mmetsp:Transcript_58080/g.66299  ORF Transcript_58080/g.66299 Transcript_58080/m.66299 type:complete len:237 (-) Transcript_58080:186-896(-)
MENCSHATCISCFEVQVRSVMVTQVCNPIESFRRGLYFQSGGVGLPELAQSCFVSIEFISITTTNPRGSDRGGNLTISVLPHGPTGPVFWDSWKVSSPLSHPKGTIFQDRVLVIAQLFLEPMATVKNRPRTSGFFNVVNKLVSLIQGHTHLAVFVNFKIEAQDCLSIWLCVLQEVLGLFYGIIITFREVISSPKKSRFGGCFAIDGIHMIHEIVAPSHFMHYSCDTRSLGLLKIQV